MKSMAPSFMAFTASSTVPKAVSRMKSTSGIAALPCDQELESREAGHPEVGEDEVDAARPQPLEGGLTVGRQHHRIALSRERPLEALPHRGVVVGDEKGGGRRGGVRHARSSLMGSVMVKVAPAPGVLVQRMVPPCSSTIWRVMESPRPVPWGLVVKNCSKRRGPTSGEMPGPVSLTDSSTLSSRRRVVTLSVPP